MLTTRRPVAVICEDDPALTNALLDTLNGMFGFDVVARATCAQEAVYFAAQVNPDLVVIDLALSGARGIGIVSALRAAAPNCSVVVLAGGPFVNLAARAVEAGAMALVNVSDLRPMRRSLQQVAARVANPLTCPARTPVGAASTATGTNVRGGQARITSQSKVVRPVTDATGADGSSSSAT